LYLLSIVVSKFSTASDPQQMDQALTEPSQDEADSERIRDWKTLRRILWSQTLLSQWRVS